MCFFLIIYFVLYSQYLQGNNALSITTTAVFFSFTRYIQTFLNLGVLIQLIHTKVALPIWQNKIYSDVSQNRTLSHWKM